MVRGRRKRERVPYDYPDRIRKLRARLGLTQARLAELLGVSFASVNRWENAQSRPNTLAWQRILFAEREGLDAFDKPILGTAPEIDDRTFSVVEPRVVYAPETEHPVAIDFTAQPEVVRLIVEAERLTYGHLFSPAFATEISMVEPLPHQRIAVYERMLTQPRLRFLLADGAGAGKTIMTGLTIREMLTRRLIRRILIVPPAGLVGNWEREMRLLFSLPFSIVRGSDARLDNPFTEPDSDLLIVSVDTLAGDQMFSRLQEPSVVPYDLVVFDEAHKLSANREPDLTVRKTARYRLAEALAGVRSQDLRLRLDWSCRHLLLLTATPHMGKIYPYYCLWRLLEPEILSTINAFNNYPTEVRQRHFIRRTKEEMVRFDGTPIYPTRISDTLSYDLTQGEIGEQRLYDETTGYIRTFYNRARVLNRSAARLAMSIFQRRLASSSYALMRSLERRLEKLSGLIEGISSGRLTDQQLHLMQRRLETLHDVLDVKTADEEDIEDGREEHEIVEDQALAAVVTTSLAELEAERLEVRRLLELAEQVYQAGEESKFEKLREVLRDPRFKDEKLIIFTEHRDTLDFLLRRLEGLGFTGQIAQIHGGMDYSEREEQVKFFRKSASEGGATYLLATDAAGEGINLQFCWLMISYDIPWNPARLEQRMGRIHRYGQEHDPVFILNLVAGKTREGRVLKTLLDKLERIGKELGSDKVFDVIGRMFVEDVSLKEYMEQAVTDVGADEVERGIEGTLTKEQVQAIEKREKQLYGDGGDVRRELPRLRTDIDQEIYHHLLPGYVHRFIEKAAPLLDIGIEGDLNAVFAFRPLKPGALDPFLSVLDEYSSDQRDRLTVDRPQDPGEGIWLHPGEPIFDRLRGIVVSRFAQHALNGAVFVDPTATRPYMFHLALISIVRQADPNLSVFTNEEILQYRLLGLKQEEAGQVEECPVERLLLLKGSQGLPASAVRFAARARDSRDMARAYAIERIARSCVEERRRALMATLLEREDFTRRGYDYQDAELAEARKRLREKIQAGDSRAKGELTRIRERQRQLAGRRQEALTTVRREPELIAPGDVTFLAHALVVPSSDPEDKKRHDDRIEAVAVSVARAYEEADGATVKDVSTPERARAAGLEDHPGFDLLSIHPHGEKRPIEVKGRAGIGNVEITENEWAKACNLRDRYWLYVVYDCASPHPRLRRVRDPFGKLIVRAKGGVIIDEREILQAAEGE